MYSFSLSQSLDDYVGYYLEVQNNTAHSYGADYGHRWSAYLSLHTANRRKASRRVSSARPDRCHGLRTSAQEYGLEH